MAYSLQEDFNNKLTLTEDTDNLFLNVLFLECAVCGEDNATKKCRKRHRGCADRRFCDAECEMIGHVKEKPVEVKGKREAWRRNDFAATIDAINAKINRREDRRRKRSQTCGSKRKAGSWLNK